MATSSFHHGPRLCGEALFRTLRGACLAMQGPLRRLMQPKSSPTTRSDASAERLTEFTSVRLQPGPQMPITGKPSEHDHDAHT